MPPALVAYEMHTDSTDRGYESPKDSGFFVNSIAETRPSIAVPDEDLIKKWDVLATLFQPVQAEVVDQKVLARNILRQIAIEPDDDSVLIERLKTLLQKQDNLLFEFANDQQELINHRALAARMAVALCDDPRSSERVMTLAGHRSPLLRLGVMYGFADRDDMDAVKTFLADSHDVVSRETRDMLEDLSE